MKRLVSGFALAALTLTGVAQADICTIEATPAATLLLPYFEVDIDDPNGVDTFLSVNNAREYSVLGHVIVWTDMSVEALDFNIYLTGYDVQTIGMGLIIRNGILPVTGDANSVSPRGSFSDAHLGTSSAIDFGSCPNFWPYEVPALDAEFLTHLQSILTGGPSSIYNGRCGGFDHGDSIARGYVTIDNVYDCTLLTPCDVGYFVVPLGNGVTELIGGYENALWGDWYMVDYANDFAQGDTLVHVEALRARIILPEGRPEGVQPVQGIDFDDFGATFWGRCATIFDEDKIVLDFREPLGTTYATRFYQNAAFDGGTDFLVWRDSLFNVYLGEEDGFSCSQGASWFPLNERQVVFFDEQENPDEACTVSPCPQADILFPLEAQRVSVADLDLVQDSGWMYANLNQLWAVEDVEVVILPFAAQAWVQAVHSAEGRFSAGLPAVQLDSMCDFRNIHIGPSGPDFPAEEPAYPPFALGFCSEGRCYETRGGAGASAGVPRNVLP
jgi:hypothetical protein